MTIFAYLNGVDVSGRLRLEDGFQTISTHADGTYAESGMKLDDPSLDLSLVQWSQVIINETACAQPRLFTGYVFGGTSSRGPFRITSSGVTVLPVADLNVLLDLLVFTAASAKRPRETGNARLTWLLASTQMAGVADNGLVGTNTALYDEADYRGQTPTAVLQDLCATSTENRVYFVYWDSSAGEPALFLDFPTVTSRTSTLSISNVLADVNNTTVFAPYMDGELFRDGSGIVDGVFVNWNGGTTYVTDHDGRLPNSLHRDAVFDTPRLGTLATAITHGQTYLDAHAAAVDEIRCTVKLPKDKVTLIEAGMRVQVKFSHLPGYTSNTYVRVAQRTLDLTPNTPEFYDVHLILTHRGVTAPSTGGGGGAPLQPGQVALVQTKFGVISAGNTLTLDAPPTEGNYLILGVASRGTSITLSGGWTGHPHGQIGPGSDFGQMGYRIVGASEPAAVPVVVSGGTRAQIWEVSGITGTPDASSFADVDTGTQPASINAGTLSPTTGQHEMMFLFLVMHCSDWGGNGATTMSTPSGWTLDGEYEVTNNGDLHPNVQGSHREESSTSGTYGTSSTIAGAGFNFGGWGGLALTFTADATLGPPVPTQPTPWTVVTMATVGGVSTGTTAFPYATNSLLVKVDGVLISRASYTETGAALTPATGAFALSWIVDADEVVTVSYLGR